MSAAAQPFELTGGETACGVTIEAVRDLRMKSLIFDEGDAVMLPAGTPPALAAATARYMLDQPVRFAGFNILDQLVYRKR